MILYVCDFLWINDNLTLQICAKHIFFESETTLYDCSCEKSNCFLCLWAVATSLCYCKSFDLFGDAAWDSHQSKDVVFYGVGDHIDDLDNTCVLVPGIGHVSMIALEDGTVPDFESRDFIISWGIVSFVKLWLPRRTKR